MLGGEYIILRLMTSGKLVCRQEIGQVMGWDRKHTEDDWWTGEELQGVRG